ncbi:NB-ARC domain containing protein [Parasponia andersonii]|uniref:NB-ARC domain containing protein n=1 Tax=Parasponia andersonii TaxID=3476 RepID=A0A2P5B1W2_PARAD|nr:NB-ARC domain containing protein [Parasponia andersonii]
MEAVGVAFVELVKCVSAPIVECVKYHKGINKYMATLKKRLNELNSQNADIEARKNVDLVSGETVVKEEVKLWLERIKNINDEIKITEEKVEKVKFFSRVDLGKSVARKIEEVKELYESGRKLLESSLVIPLPERGDPLPTITIEGRETTFERKIQEIWESLIDDGVTKIGVYGMGGIGKTTALEHINNMILENKDKFDSVIWVTVSKDSDLTNLQEKIAHKLGLDISKEVDQKTREGKLYKQFNTKRKYVLILDDLWYAHSLKEVGIPEPENGCKLVLTTRSRDVCNKMSCKPIFQIEFLSEDDAMDLFLETVGRDVLSIGNLEKTLKEIVQQCAGLPLAVVTIAKSLKGTVNLYEWEIALEKLKKCTKGSESDAIIERLKFSYDRLNDKRLQDCLLYCALYPEDYEIDRALLIEHLIVEEIIEESNTRQYQIKEGQAMLAKLVNLCLLNNVDKYARYVKMHDLVRDMALRITSESPRFLVKAGLGLKTIPNEENWKGDTLKVSLMDNNIYDIPPSFEPPKCRKLSTLLLCKNTLRSISDNFFLHMKGLCVLDLSYTRIANLPESVSNLVNLTALLLKRCEELKYVPSLAKLKRLRKLDFFETGVIEVPHGMEMLVKLRYLDFSLCRLEFMPDGVLRKLVNLQYLSLMFLSTTPRIKGEDLACLRNLETFHVLIDDINNYNVCVKSLENRGLTNYIFICQSQFSQEYLSWIVHSSGGDKFVYLRECKLSESILLPEDVEKLRIEKCNVKVSRLYELVPFNVTTKLRCLEIKHCQLTEYLFSCLYSYNSRLLQNLERLDLDKLSNLNGLFETEKFGSPQLGFFSSLRYLRIHYCNNLKKLFILDNASIPSLEEIFIKKCNQLEELISSTKSDDEDQNQEKGGTDHHAIDLPKLRSLHLSRLPKLHRIPFIAKSLQDVCIYDCPNLKRIDPLLDRERCPPLQYVRIDRNIWRSLQWDYTDAKNFVQSFMDPDGYSGSEEVEELEGEKGGGEENEEEEKEGRKRKEEKGKTRELKEEINEQGEEEREEKEVEGEGEEEEEREQKEEEGEGEEEDKEREKKEEGEGEGEGKEEKEEQSEEEGETEDERKQREGEEEEQSEGEGETEEEGEEEEKEEKEAEEGEREAKKEKREQRAGEGIEKK